MFLFVDSNLKGWVFVMNAFKRSVLAESGQQQACDVLQASLVTLLDLSLVLKQAHWNVVGNNFRSLHLQLDEIINTVRNATDEVAERIVTIGRAADGRASTIAGQSQLEVFPEGLHQVPKMIAATADCLKKAIDQIREGIEVMSDVDPISEDLLIGIASQLEKHLWMVQAQEL